MSFITNIMNTAHTQNDALSHKSSMSACLDLFSMGVSADHSTKIKLITDALVEDPILATKTILYLRDARNGQGHKDILHAYFEVLASKPDYSIVMLDLLVHIPEIGYWKDLIKLYHTQPLIRFQLLHIFSEAVRSGNNLASKWLPRQGPLAQDIAFFMNLDHGTYRRLIVSQSKTVEQDMSSNQWSSINYPAVPSVANKRYAKAFARHDSSRYSEHLQAVLNGTSKANSSVLYPHEIAHMVSSSPATADALWTQLPNYMTAPCNILPIIDLSSSMTDIAYSSYSCMDIAIGLGIYFAEHNQGDYKDVWCNFSDTPNFYKLEGSTLSQKMNSLDRSNWDSSTDLQAVFDIILKQYDANPNANDLPQAILIVSDMEFNCIK
jgi:hypothetical protein